MKKIMYFVGIIVDIIAIYLYGVCLLLWSGIHQFFKIIHLRALAAITARAAVECFKIVEDRLWTIVVCMDNMGKDSDKIYDIYMKLVRSYQPTRREYEKEYNW